MSTGSNFVAAPSEVAPKGERAARAGLGVTAFVCTALCDGFAGPHFAGLAESFTLLILLAVGACFGFGGRSRADRLSGVGWAGFLCGAAATRAADGPASLFGVALAFASLGSKPRLGAWAARLAAAVAAFGALSALRGVGWVRAAFDGAAAALSTVVGAATGHEIRLGPSALGIDAALAAGCICAALLRRGSPLRRAAVAVGVPLAWTTAYVVRFVLDAAARRTFTTAGFEEGPIWFADLPYLHLALAATIGAVAFGAKDAAIDAATPASPVRRRALGAFAFSAAVGLACFDPPPVGGSLRIAVATENSDPETPAPSEFDGGGYLDAHDAARLYLRYLRAAGHAVRSVRTAEAAAAGFPDADVVVMCFPETPDRRSIPALRRFVERGGGLLLVADHTPEPQRLAVLNEFLAEAGLEQRFDSAFLHSMPLERCARRGLGRCETTLRAVPEDNFGVGGSYRIGPRAESLLDARWAVADRGHESTPSLVGNRHYEHGDSLGDAVVVARGEIGAGRVVVVGDTTCFMDSALPFCFGLVNEFVLAAGPRRLRFPPYVRAALALAALAVGIGVLRFSLDAKAALCVASAALFAGRVAAPDAVSWRPNSGLAIVDMDGGSSVVSFDRDPQGSIKGFTHALARSGLLPLVVDDRESALAAGPAFAALPAPVRFDDADCEAYDRYLRAGGRLAVAVGAREARAVDALLSRAGWRVLPVALGGTRQESFDRAATDDGRAGSLRREAAWEAASTVDSPFETLAAAKGRPFVVRRAYGAGELTLVADAHFFCDRNVATAKAGWPPNQEFLRRLVAPRTEGPR